MPCAVVNQLYNFLLIALLVNNPVLKVQFYIGGRKNCIFTPYFI